MEEAQSSVLARNLLEVFNERDEAKRFQVIQELYTTHAIFFEADGSFTGAEAINKRVTEVLKTIPIEAIFRPSSSMSKNHNVARLPWTLITKHGPVMASGMDVALLEGDRIAALYLFIDAQ